MNRGNGFVLESVWQRQKWQTLANGGLTLAAPGVWGRAAPPGNRRERSKRGKRLATSAIFVTFHPCTCLCNIERKSVGNCVREVQRKTLESKPGLLLAPLVSTPTRLSTHDPYGDFEPRAQIHGSRESVGLADRFSPGFVSGRITSRRTCLGQRFLGLRKGRVLATMAGQYLPVPRLEGVSQEHFMQHLYPQVRSSCRSDRRKPGDTCPYYSSGSELVSCDPGCGVDAAGG